MVNDQSARIRAVMLALLLMSLSGIAASAQLRAGQAAPGFELPDLEGRTHSLADLRKQGHVLLLFWSVNCHFCHKMIPEFKELHARYTGRGVELVAVNVGYENRHDIEHYVRDNALPYLILNDDERKEEIIELYGLVGTPTFVLVAPDGRIRSVGHRIPTLPAPRARPRPVAPALPDAAPDTPETDPETDEE